MSDYCAYATMRRDAARNRNYNNCKLCKTDRQKCTGKPGVACERCLKLRKTCSLLDTPSTTDGRPGKSTATGDSTRLSTREEDERRFGQILLAIPCSDGMSVELIHVKFGNNRQEQVYRTQCNTNYEPLAPSEYLGPRIEYEEKLRLSMSSVNIQDMMEAMNTQY